MVLSAWGFIGRASELSRLTDVATDAAGRSLVFGGSAGIGKSRLLREGMKNLDPSVPVLSATATVATSTLPFGGLAHVLPFDQPPGLSPAGLLRWALDALDLNRAARQPILTVDDAHLLDPLSATLVYYVAKSGHAKVFATVRTGEPAPDPIRALWTEGLAERIDLEPLSEHETGELLSETLGGQMDAASTTRLWRLSQGNALLLRELVLAAQAAGEMTQSYGIWRWSGTPRMASTLTEVIDARIGSLSPEVLQVLEFTALGEPIGLPLLTAATSAEAIERAEERQLIQIDAEGKRTNVRLAHPLYGEVVRKRCPVLRARRQLAQLATLVEAAGARRRDDLLRVAVWRLESHTAEDVQLLLRACQQAFAGFDIPLAVRLGQGALAAADHHVDVAEAVATLTMFADRPEQALSILDRVAAEEMTSRQRAGWIAARGITTYWGLIDLDTPARIEAEAAVIPESSERTRVSAIQTMQLVHRNDYAEATRVAQTIFDCPDATVGTRALALSGISHLRAARGRPLQTIQEMAEADSGSAAWRGETPYFQLALEIARGTAMYLAGDVDGIEAVAAAEFAGLAGAGEFSMGSGYQTVVRAQGARLRGNVVAASRWARQALALLAPGRVFGGLASAELAHALALCGDATAAAEALQEADRLQEPTMAVLYPHFEQARAWVAVALGDKPGALNLLRQLVVRLRADGFAGYEVHALHDLVRLGAAEETVDRLSTLAGEVQGALAPLAARHAAAAAAHKGSALHRLAEDYAAHDLRLYAAEAATAAIAELRHDRSLAAAGVHERLAALRAACEHADTPGLRLPSSTLTDRERQIALLAAAGVPSKQIADRIFLSPRTVDNHLMRVYVKLGVSGRADLAAALKSLD